MESLTLWLHLLSQKIAVENSKIVHPLNLRELLYLYIFLMHPALPGLSTVPFLITMKRGGRPGGKWSLWMYVHFVFCLLCCFDERHECCLHVYIALYLHILPVNHIQPQPLHLIISVKLQHCPPNLDLGTVVHTWLHELPYLSYYITMYHCCILRERIKTISHAIMAVASGWAGQVLAWPPFCWPNLYKAYLSQAVPWLQTWFPD